MPGTRPRGRRITKGFRGYDLCKSVYNKYANEDLVLHNGSNTYTFDPKKCANEMSLFGDSLGAVEALKELLCKEYKDKNVTALDLFETHQKTSKYSREHYTAALRKAVKEGMAEARYTDGKNHKVSVLIDPACVIHFNRNLCKSEVVNLVVGTGDASGVFVPAAS